MTHLPLTRVLITVLLVITLGVVLPVDASGNDDGRVKRVTVRCDKRETIGSALRRSGDVLVLTIHGVCHENVVIDRNDVSLVAAHLGAGIDGPDLANNAVMVTGDRFLLDGLTVTGGRNGVVVAGGGRATIQNCVVKAGGNDIVGGIGILFFQGANGTVDACDSSGNNADGLMLDAATATITNSTFHLNKRAGIIVFHGSIGRIGMTNRFGVAPNTITDNGSAGIHVTLGSLGVIVGNTISGNGTNPFGPFGRTGITVFHSRVDLPGGNKILNNKGQGMLIAAGSSAAVGDPGFGIPPVNEITGNGGATGPQAAPNGITVTVNSTLGLRDAKVQNNTGIGVAVLLRSVLNMVGGSITGNTNNGIQLMQGGAANFQPSPATGVPAVSGNGAPDLQCLDAESSYGSAPIPGATTGIATIGVACTGF